MPSANQIRCIQELFEVEAAWARQIQIGSRLNRKELGLTRAFNGKPKEAHDERYTWLSCWPAAPANDSSLSPAIGRNRRFPSPGQYRIIDITLSELYQLRPAPCLYPDPVQGALAQSPYPRRLGSGGWRTNWASLSRFCRRCSGFRRAGTEGTADAVYQNIYSIGSEEPKYVIILSGDHIYKMNYARMLQQHVDTKAEVTIGDAADSPR